MSLIVNIYRFTMIKISLDDMTEILPIKAKHAKFSSITKYSI
jgi:hypothetical protein